MARTPFVTVLLFLLALCAYGQEGASPPSEKDTVCTFADGQQISVRYAPVANSMNELPRGQAWVPGDQPMYLFSQAELQFGSTTVPTGAYSLYVIPGAQDWTLVVNRGVEKGKPYDSSKDVTRAEMTIEKLPKAADHLNLYFGHIAPKTCNLRMDYGKQRAVVAFTEK